jgi:phosphoenolpyruvate carboxylase
MSEELIDKLQEENEDLKSKLIDLQFELNYNKQTELIEFLREIYSSLKDVDENLTKEEMIKNLKHYIQVFARDNKIML